MKILFNTIIISLICLSALASDRSTPVSEAIKKIQNSVVSIRTEVVVNNNSPFNNPAFDDFFGYSSSYKAQSLGSGVIISSDGLILTNNHVIDSATKITVTLTNNSQYEASLIGTDPLLDLAVLKLKGTPRNLPPAKLGTSSDLILGETVIAMGNPYGLNASVTTGIVSNVKRIFGDQSGFSIYIQTDALINPGNSGGPLMNIDGEVIGINTAIRTEAQGISFAIPIDTIKRIIPEFLRYGKIRRGYTGFTPQEYDTENGKILKITEIMRGSSAQKQGVEINDRIFTLDGVPVNTLSAYSYLLRTYPAGETIPIEIMRNGRKLSLLVKLTELPKYYGLAIIKSRYGLSFIEQGNIVTVSASDVARYINKGDVILEANGVAINSIEKLANALNEYNYETITISFARNNRIMSIKLNL